MLNFNFYSPTKVLFGKNKTQELVSILKPYGKNVLLTYGGGSVKRNGIYQKTLELLKDFNVTELSGIEPNPRLETVKKGIKICKDKKIDVILAVGGGSTIDCSKVIAAGFYYDGEPWDIMMDASKITNALPIVTILTVSATGSEMNRYAVITNTDTNQKVGVGSQVMIPKVSILDPEHLYSLPSIQTAAGTADIISHIIENYFCSQKDTFIADRLSEGLLKTCIRYGPIALKEPNNYEARANLMWASSLALNGICGCGKLHEWSCHPIEHELSAFYNITHGIGLAIVTPRWMRYILSEKTVDKFVDFALNVWNLPMEEDKFSLANKAIDLTGKFFKDCNIPMTLEEVGIDDSKFDIMSEDAVKLGNLSNAYIPLDKNDVKKIFEMCLK